MAKRTAKFACAILVGIAGSTLLSLLPHVAAAEDCLTEPTGDKADGQHWYYRFDRGSSRRCWYLKDAAGNAKDATTGDIAPRSSSQPSSAWDFAQPAPPKFAPRRGDDTAKASTTTGTSSVVRTQPASATFDDKLKRDMPATPWQPPQTQLLDSADIDTPAATSTTADAPVTDVNSADSAAPTDAGAAASAKPAKPTAPIHKLLIVVVGALTLSGLLASAQYRLGKAGRARRRNRNWQRAIARTRRNRDKPHNKSKVVPAGARAGRAMKPAAPAVRIAPAPPPAVAGAVELPPAIVVAPANSSAPAVEPALRAKPSPAKASPAQASTIKPPVATSHPKPAPQTAAMVTSRPIEPPLAQPPAARTIVDPAAELVDLLGAHAAKKAVQQPKQTDRSAADAGTLSPTEAAPPRLPRIEDPEAELANLLESRFAPPAAPPVRHAVGHPAANATAMASAPAAKKIVDPISELAHLLEAKENQRAARLANAAAPRRENAQAIRAEPPLAAQPRDPAAELLGMLEARAARSTQPPAQPPQPDRAAQPEPSIKAAQRIEPAQPTRPEPAKATQQIKPMQQPAGAAAARRKKTPPAPRAEVARADSAPVKTVRGPARAAEPVERAAGPKPGKVTGKASRRKNADLRPLPPALMETANHDGPTPPLDFIPRPQALRPRVQDIRQDESLDGVQDILARLARHG